MVGGSAGLRVPGSPCSPTVSGGAVSAQRELIGSRRSRPNALSEIFGPGGYCRRLYSAGPPDGSPLDQRRVVPGRDQVVPPMVPVDVAASTASRTS